MRLLHPTLNNVAKMPTETLLLNIWQWDFLFGQEGNLIMEYTQSMEMVNVIKLEQSIRWHLQCNFYPPVSSDMIPIAVKAVMLCRNDQFDEKILIPFEHWSYGWLVSAYVIVETYLLEPLVDDLGV